MIQLHKLAATGICLFAMITALRASAEPTEKLGPRGLCAECGVEARGPAANAREVFFRSLPQLSEIVRECPKAKQESTLLISQFDPRRAAQLRMQLGFVFGENSAAAEVVTLYGSYFAFDTNPGEPTTLLNFLAFRTAAQAGQIGAALEKAPNVKVAVSDRFLYLLLPTKPMDDRCQTYVHGLLRKNLDEASKSLTSSKLGDSMREILFAEGTMLDSAVPLTDTQLKELESHREAIFSIALSQPPTSIGYQALKQFPNIEVLSVGPTRLAVDDIKAIATLSNLRQLRAGSCNLSDVASATLSVLPRLEELSLRDNPLTDQSAKSIVKIKTLVSLGLARTQIGDGGMIELSKLPNLQSLFLAKTAVGDAGVASFIGHKNLRMLMLHGTKITDKVVESLLAIPKLQHVGLSETAVSQSAITKLKKARPQLLIS